MNRASANPRILDNDAYDITAGNAQHVDEAWDAFDNVMRKRGSGG